ncbi:MAG TPA: protein kinase [Polyangia bacterium]|nr:protein kinase [Polyangia bacterium]
MANDLRFSGVRMTTSTNVTGSTAGEGLPERDPSASTWQAGTHFSRYEIDSRLAAGGMAEVWRAKLKGVRGFEKRIVIKTMLPQLAGRPDLVEMFINEATLASAFSHPNIAHVFDFGQLEGRYFIAMEYVPGVTLRFAHKRMLARGDLLPIAATLHVMIDVCEALHDVHELGDGHGALGIVHRDLSPDNVIISTSGGAKLIDFGAARATTRTPLSSVFVGKYRYAAPERIRRTSEDRRSDVYSAGVILYECLTGARPYDGPDPEVARAAVAGRVHDPRARSPSLPASLAEVVMRAMAPEPSERFATARQLREALTRCLVELGASSKEHDVTASLAALIEPPVEPSPILIAPVMDEEGQGVPEAIEISAEPSSGIDVALCEVEIIEASGPIHALSGPTRTDDPPTLPALPSRGRPIAPQQAPPPPAPPQAREADPSAPHWSAPGQLFERVFGGPSGAAPGLLGWRHTPEQPPHDSQRAPLQRAVEMFDRGIELRAAGRYGEALEAWERALALAPQNRVYQSNVARLRGQLDELRRAERQLAEWSGALRSGDD